MCGAGEGGGAGVCDGGHVRVVGCVCMTTGDVHGGDMHSGEGMHGKKGGMYSDAVGAECKWVVHILLECFPVGINVYFQHVCYIYAIFFF